MAGKRRARSRASLRLRRLGKLLEKDIDDLEHESFRNRFLSQDIAPQEPLAHSQLGSEIRYAAELSRRAREDPPRAVRLHVPRELSLS